MGPAVPAAPREPAGVPCEAQRLVPPAVAVGIACTAGIVTHPGIMRTAAAEVTSAGVVTPTSAREVTPTSARVVTPASARGVTAPPPRGVPAPPTPTATPTAALLRR